MVSASDYSIRISGLRRSCITDVALRAWAAHYGGVVAAFAVPSVGDCLRLGRGVDELTVRWVGRGWTEL